MDKEELFSLADKVGLGFIKHASAKDIDKFKQFAALITSAEREACAKMCDALAVHPEYASEVTKLAALAIRARG